MSVVLPLVVYLVFASVSLYVLAVLLYLQDRQSSELQSSARLIMSVGATALAFASVLWMEDHIVGLTLRFVQ